MTQPTIGGFFTGGGKGITWPEQPGMPGPDGQPGRTMASGTITAIHPAEEILDPKDQKPTGKFQVRMELATEERDPQADFDDGARTLYVKSYMRGAIGDALRRQGLKEPKVGGKLTVVFTKTEPPERPGLSASKHFEASYEPPAVSTAGYFNGQGQAPAPGYAPGQAAPAPQYAQQPPPQAYQAPQYAQQAAMQPPPQQQYAAPPVQQAPPQAEPPRPEAISEQAWAAMDIATKNQVAATMANVPPF